MRPLLPLVLLLFLGASQSAIAQQPADTAAKWSFSRDQAAAPREEHSNALAKLEGKYQYVSGVSGDGLRLDGYTTSMSVNRKDLPSLGPDGFTAEAWVALNTYPWNWVPVVEQQNEHQAGFFLGIDAFGHVAFMPRPSTGSGSPR